jgi:DNA-binding transcriptional LysR family regulator
MSEAATAVPITLRQIEAFRAVMEAGTVIEAAGLMHLSQPAVSRLIGDLEATLGYGLFARIRGRLVPTDEAHVLYAEVQRAFIGLDQIAQTALHIRTHQVGRIRLITMPALAGGALSHAISSFLHANPGTSISFEVRPRRQVLEWIGLQQMDIGFATLPISDPAIKTIPLARSRYVCLLPPGHRLARKRRIHVRDLEGEEFISIMPEAQIRAWVDSLFESHGVTRRSRLDVRTNGVVFSLVGAGAGVGLVDLFGVEHRSLDHVTVRPLDPELSVELALLLPASRSESRIVRSFIDTYFEQLSRYASALPPTMRDNIHLYDSK